MLRLQMQRIDSLPALTARSLPANDSQAILYAKPQLDLLEASRDTVLVSTPGCVATPCSATRVTAAKVVSDVELAQHSTMMAHVSGAQWLRAVLRDPAWLASMQASIEQAGQGHIGNARSEWLTFAATGVAGAGLRGRRNAPRCARGGNTAECACTTAPAHDFDPSLYAVRQVPVLRLNVELQDGAPASVRDSLQSAFQQIVPPADKLGHEVCAAHTTAVLSPQPETCPHRSVACHAGGVAASEACPASCFGDAVEVNNGRVTVSNCLSKSISFISVDVGCTGVCTSKYEEVRARDLHCRATALSLDSLWCL